MTSLALRNTSMVACTLLSALLVVACSRNSDPADQTAASEQAAPSPVVTNPTVTPLPTATPTPARAIDKEKVTKRFCLVRQVPSGIPEVPATTRLPIAAIEADQWATMKDRDVKLVIYDDATHCTAGEFSGDYKLRIQGPSNGRFEVTVRESNAPDKPVLSQTFELSPSGAYMFAKADGCTPDDDTCGTHDRFDAYIYIADVRDNANDLAKLVMLDLFALSEGALCNAERLSEGDTVVPDPQSCEVPQWVYDRFGIPETRAGVNSQRGLAGIRQTGSGGGYEPPP